MCSRSGSGGSKGGGGGGQFDAALKSELDKKSLYIKGEPYTYNEVEEYLKANGVQLAQVGEDVERAEWFNFEISPHYMQPYDVKIIGESASGKAYKVEFEADTLDGEHSPLHQMPQQALRNPLHGAGLSERIFCHRKASATCERYQEYRCFR